MDQKMIKLTEAEFYSTVIKNMVIAGYITSEDLLPVIKKGTMKMLNEPEEKIFKKNPAL